MQKGTTLGQIASGRVSFSILSQISRDYLDPCPTSISIGLFSAETELEKVGLGTVIAEQVGLVIEVVHDQVQIPVPVKIGGGCTP
jgi:hypothetical protein